MRSGCNDPIVVTGIPTKDASDNILSQYTYGLDVKGRRQSLTELSGRTSSWTYDSLYRLTQENIVDPVNGNPLTDYVYSATGNRTSQTQNGTTTNYIYDSNDRLLSEGSNTCTYDNQGNMLSQTDGAVTQTYSYNAENKLIQFNNGSGNIVYEYNADGIRVNKTQSSQTTDFIVDSNLQYAQVIAEQDDTDVINKAYVYGHDLISQSISGNSYFYHYDSLGTTRELSDGSGNISDSYGYDAFGEVQFQSGSTDNNYLYTGEQFDADLDNYYLRARYYNQGVGRFTQMDTWLGKACTPITLNKYIYANGDGINFIDPSGYVGFDMRGMMSGLTHSARQQQRSVGSYASFLIKGSNGKQSLSKGIGCKIGTAYLKRKFAAESVQGHHAIPKNLGGDPGQDLIYIPSTTHHMFHWVLHVMLKNDPAAGGMGNWTSKKDWTEISATKSGRKMLYNHIFAAAKVVDKFCGLKHPAALASFVKKHKAAYLRAIN